MTELLFWLLPEGRPHRCYRPPTPLLSDSQGQSSTAPELRYADRLRPRSEGAAEGGAWLLWPLGADLYDANLTGTATARLPTGPPASPLATWCVADKMRRSGVDTELWDHSGPPISGLGRNLTYHGGLLLQHVRVPTLFWGQSLDPSGVSGYFNHFFEALFADGRYMANLSQYGAGGYRIGKEQYLDILVAPDGTRYPVQKVRSVKDGAPAAFTAAQAFRRLDVQGIVKDWPGRG